jgi:hypothetical protein
VPGTALKLVYSQLMSAREGDIGDNVATRNPGSETHALALATPHRLVVIASPISTARTPAFGISAGVFVLDPLREADADAIGPLQPPNDGPAHTAIPRWGVYDFAEVPGAVVGLLRTPVSSPYRRPLDPLAVLLATPHAEPGTWHLYGLTVRSPDGPTPAIRAELIRIAINVLRADRATLILRWGSRLLDLLVARHAIEVLAARTPLHGPDAEHDPVATLMLSRGPAQLVAATSTPFAALPQESEELAAFADRVQACLNDGHRLELASLTPAAIAAGSRVRLVVQEIRS